MKITPFAHRSTLEYSLHDIFIINNTHAQRKTPKLHYTNLAEELKKSISACNDPKLSIIDTYLGKFEFSRSELREEKSFLKEYDFFNIYINEEDFNISKIKLNKEEKMQWAITIQIFTDLTIKNIISIAIKTLSTHHSLKTNEVKSILIIICHALDYFDANLLINLLESIDKPTSLYEDLKNSPQNKLLSIEKKFEAIFAMDINMENISEAKRIIQNIKSSADKDSIFEWNQIQYAEYIIQEAILFNFKNENPSTQKPPLSSSKDAKKSKNKLKNSIFFKIHSFFQEHFPGKLAEKQNPPSSFTKAKPLLITPRNLI